MNLFSFWGQRTKGNGFTHPDSDNALSVMSQQPMRLPINADTNATLYQKNGTDRISPASTAKMITADRTGLLFSGRWNEGRRRDRNDAWWFVKSMAYEGWYSDRQTALNCPYASFPAMMQRIRLQWIREKKIAGDKDLSDTQAIDVFSGCANVQKANSLARKNSNFVVPDGYDADGQYTTAYDLAIIAKSIVWMSYVFPISWQPIRLMKDGPMAGRSHTRIQTNSPIQTANITGQGSTGSKAGNQRSWRRLYHFCSGH